jgi:hypothetical protein
MTSRLDEVRAAMATMFRPKSAPAKSALFFVTFKVQRGTNVELPAQFDAAYVPVYAAGQDHELALRSAISKVESQGFEIADMGGTMQELDARKWAAYVHQTWPEYLSHFPPQDEVIAGLEDGIIFFGPLICYAHDA